MKRLAGSCQGHLGQRQMPAAKAGWNPALLAPGPAPSQEVEVPLLPCFQMETTDRAVTLATFRAGAVARTNIMYANKSIQAQQPGKKKLVWFSPSPKFNTIYSSLTFPLLNSLKTSRAAFPPLFFSPYYTNKPPEKTLEHLNMSHAHTSQGLGASLNPL